MIMFCGIGLRYSCKVALPVSFREIKAQKSPKDIYHILHEYNKLMDWHLIVEIHYTNHQYNPINKTGAFFFRALFDDYIFS